MNALDRIVSMASTSDLPVIEARKGWENQAVLTFMNGYSASILREVDRSKPLTVNNKWAPTYRDDEFEVAVLNRDMVIVYDTPVTGDVVRWLDAESLAGVLRQIADLGIAP